MALSSEECIEHNCGGKGQQGEEKGVKGTASPQHVHFKYPLRAAS